MFKAYDCGASIGLSTLILSRSWRHPLRGRNRKLMRIHAAADHIHHHDTPEQQHADQQPQLLRHRRDKEGGDLTDHPNMYRQRR